MIFCAEIEHKETFSIVALLILELMQLILRRGSFDIDDVLLNTIGAVIGYTVYRIGKRLH
ncbi:VanZ family protein [Paenibacillus sp. sptzw28]|uniref:VanZ family protein n=1 Tax=Paenibacillus sp. sptzw28 TaxID=715179 RepID=UPI0021627F68|nr:VanZ family protein [Paenibacillus sp. sptzw28]